MRIPRKIAWTIFASHIALSFLTMAVVAWFASHYIRNLYINDIEDNLIGEIELFTHILPDDLSLRNAAIVDSLVQVGAEAASIRLTVVVPGGAVIADSDEDYRTMENHADRPEIRSALNGLNGISRRYSYTIKREMMYVAVPVYRNDNVAGAVRASVPIKILDIAITRQYHSLLQIIVIISLIVIVMSYVITRWLNTPFTRIAEGVDTFSRGNLTHRIHVDGFIEYETLADKMNEMAKNLYDRMNIISRQRNEIEAILSSMREAVVAVDCDSRIIEYNMAADDIFNISHGKSDNARLQEIIRNSQIEEYVRKTLEGSNQFESEIVVRGDVDRTMLVHGTRLFDAEGRQIGAVIVLADISKQKRLESIRRDFVSNVSHELKTPITSIMGFVETLQNGSVEDPKVTREFLDIIMRHSRRLDAIIEDLLYLARMEQGLDDEVVQKQTVGIDTIITNAVSVCAKKAAEKHIDILHDQTDIRVNVHQSMIEQALVNLIDNAIAYSHENSRVTIQAGREKGWVAVSVVDQGIGIPRQHIGRIFERFYRVDKGRSREQGGTGLGLAIVNHIMMAHGGRVEVSSEFGKGSTFTLYFPAV